MAKEVTLYALDDSLLIDGKKLFITLINGDRFRGIVMRVNGSYWINCSEKTKERANVYGVRKIKLNGDWHTYSPDIKDINLLKPNDNK